MPVFTLFLVLVLITLVFFLILSREEKDKIEFFHVMAHRFRSPISIIKWYIELLSDKSVGNLNDKQEKYFTEIYNASEKLTETIESLIVLLQLQSNNLTVKIESVEIKDNGYGIPKEKRSKILADSVNFKDMGFSLYLVRLILKKLRANINFKSEENTGTTFSISLPANA